MHLQYRNLKLIEKSGRPDKDNEDILSGVYDGFEKTLTRDERLKLMFSDWQEGDILVIADQPLKHPKLSGDTLVEMTREEVCATGDLSILDVGEVYQDGQIIKVEYDESLGYLKRTWNKLEHIWYEGATEEEITEHMGVLVTKLLYDVMSIGCEVTVDGEKHQQSLDDDKRKALNERVSGFALAQELGSPITQVAWPFKDDGTDTIVMRADEFKQMALYCLGYGEKCYIAAELLKAKRKVNSTIDDFYNELKNVDAIALENL